MATTLLSISYVFVLGPGFLDLVYKSSHRARSRDRGAHSYVILLFCQSPNFKFAKFYTEPFQAISPNLMAAKISRYTIYTGHYVYSITVTEVTRPNSVVHVLCRDAYGLLSTCSTRTQISFSRSFSVYRTLKHTLISVPWRCWARNCSHR